MLLTQLYPQSCPKLFFDSDLFSTDQQIAIYPSMTLLRARPNQQVTKQALKILLSDDPIAASQLDLVRPSRPGTVDPESNTSRTPRPYIPTALTETSSILDYKRKKTHIVNTKYDTVFGKKLESNIIANILATPSRADRLTRYVISRGTLVRLGVVSKDLPSENESESQTEGIHKKTLELVPIVSKRPAVAEGFNGYIIGKRRYFQALIPRYIHTVMGMATTSSKIVQQRVRSIANNTLKWTSSNKKGNGKKASAADGPSQRKNERPKITFTVDEGIADFVPQQLYAAIKNSVKQKGFKKYYSAGLALKPKEYYFTLAWGQSQQAADFEADSMCTEVVHVDNILTADQSTELQHLIESVCPKGYIATGDKSGFIKVPSALGMDVHMLLWRYRFYESD